MQNIILQQGDSTAESRTSLQIQHVANDAPLINLSLFSSVPALYLGVAMSKRTCGLSTSIPELSKFSIMHGMVVLSEHVVSVFAGVVVLTDLLCVDVECGGIHVVVSVFVNM